MVISTIPMRDSVASLNFFFIYMCVCIRYRSKRAAIASTITSMRNTIYSLLILGRLTSTLSTFEEPMHQNDTYSPVPFISVS